MILEQQNLCYAVFCTESVHEDGLKENQEAAETLTV